jgi:hypothetical protein
MIQERTSWRGKVRTIAPRSGKWACDTYVFAPPPFCFGKNVRKSLIYSIKAKTNVQLTKGYNDIIFA